MLAGDIGGRAGKSNQPRHRRAVDDYTAAIGEHGGDFILHAEVHALQVDRNHPIELVLGVFVRDGVDAFDPGVVEREIEPPERLHGIGNHLLDLIGDGNIGPDHDCLAALSPDHFNGFIAARRGAIDHHHFGAFASERQRGRPANAGSGAGDQGHLAFELSGHTSAPFIIFEPLARSDWLSVRRFLILKNDTDSIMAHRSRTTKRRRTMCTGCLTSGA